MLVTLNEIKTYLGINNTTYDTFLTDQLNVYSSTVENYCARKFALDTYTQTFYKDDFDDYRTGFLPLYHYPVSSITSVTLIESSEGVDTVSTVLDSYKYRLKKEAGKLFFIDGGQIQEWFSSVGYDTRIVVVFEAGYSTIPYEIQYVVKALVEEKYNKKISGVELGFGSDVQSISIPGTISVTYDYTLQSNERKTKFGVILGNYVNVLDPFRSERAVVGEIGDNYVS